MKSRWSNQDKRKNEGEAGVKLKTEKKKVLERAPGDVHGVQGRCSRAGKKDSDWGVWVCASHIWNSRRAAGKESRRGVEKFFAPFNSSLERRILTETHFTLLRSPTCKLDIVWFRLSGFELFLSLFLFFSFFFLWSPRRAARTLHPGL